MKFNYYRMLKVKNDKAFHYYTSNNSDILV